ncbi:PREDICTED: rho guanine nucleotide exchange factor 2-like [Tinamus guttatus]|uniref:rho guanine nucleotide exchange factor 2-like n=1 Tax=Tinamus guttatus TaxID=94827 RepID=UPI00052F4008|nr:PREDICTED: rho guanine nucleotide exchange factor 2-like [Tinamus guttatus]
MGTHRPRTRAAGPGRGGGRPTRCGPSAELIQTEIHHVRTLKIMANMFRKGMLEELQLEPATVQSIFPCVDELGQIHERFLAQLLERRKESLAQDSNKNFVINRLGDILVNQFSGAGAEQLKKAYSEFCSRHNKAVKLYKELLARDKRFQQFIRRMTRSPLLRRHGEMGILEDQNAREWASWKTSLPGDAREWRSCKTSLPGLPGDARAWGS